MIYYSSRTFPYISTRDLFVTACLPDGCLVGKCKEARYNEILPITSYFGIRVCTPTTQPSYVGFLGSIRLRWNSESVSFASACQTPSRARHNKGHSERIGVHLLLLSSSVALLFHRYVCHCTGNDNNFLAGLHITQRSRQGQRSSG